MTPAPPRLTITSARLATPADLGLLQGIEEAADDRFTQLAGRPPGWPAARSGQRRAAAGGTLVVVGSPVVGFAQVLEVAGEFHLEQLSVLPQWGRQGVGAMLLAAAYGLAADAGRRRVVVRTFADVPWNGPWYAAHGFREVPTPPTESTGSTGSVGSTEIFGPRISMAREIRDEPAPIDAVSVLPVRDGPHGIEGFVQHRVSSMDFAAGALVFPGGRVDPADTAAGQALPLPAGLAAEHAGRWRHTAAFGVGASGEVSARTILATGVREVAEETGARIDPARLVPWDDWVTPIGNPRRFDVRFLLYAADPAVRFGHTTTEAHRSEWLPLADVVRRAERGELALLPPTRTLVDELCALGTAAAALARRPAITAVHHDLTPSRPRAATR